MTSRRWRWCLITGLCVSLIGPSAVLAQSDPSARLKSVQTLLESSTAARQIQQSGNAEASALYDQAREALAAARNAVAAGDNAAADGHILTATKTMLEAVRLADREAIVDAKQKDDFSRRMDSVDALLDAYARVGEEKNEQASVAQLRGIVDAKRARANELLAAGRTADARTLLDETYVALKTAIEQLRGGETLVRTLHFASKEEEYHYELDRNDTHRMLVDVLLSEKMADPRISKMVNTFMARAADLRKKAEGQAARSRFDEAVTTLEDSTREVVRAIRSAGIYIPGS